MTHGRVVVFYDKRGWGLITDGSRTIFVHYTQIISTKPRKTLHKGQFVTFDLYLDPKDPERFIARSVVVL